MSAHGGQERQAPDYLQSLVHFVLLGIDRSHDPIDLVLLPIPEHRHLYCISGLLLFQQVEKVGGGAHRQVVPI